ncbi:arylamine N-acetyltransferase family protein [Gordonia crocea]|uniref:Putative arylamine n-acetyl transferase n=1 Tax=Gordonia crocea TaxID=589162 RepID=A0A7M3SV92_9ACTN|nr:arylamine N-acetyltransferase [Gordonia crocea]GED96566.1 putative arylamine n-acetyl transferase [Gordonia crocea]
MGHWHGDELDRDAVLARIGYTGDTAPTPATLAALHRAYATSIPFENLDILIDRPIRLDVESLQDKMIHRRHGGYCFEHAALFAALLESLGYRFSALIGRVTLGAPPHNRPATHALLLVEFADGARYLCDVGFGRGPLEPLELVDGATVDQDGWRLRLTGPQTGDDAAAVLPVADWALWQRTSVDGEVGWVDRHRFPLAPKFPIDFAVASHFVSTSPRSPFTMRPFVQRFTPERHDTLDGDTVTTIAPDGRIVETRTVAVEELPQLLADVFDIDLDDDEARALVAAVPGLPGLTPR